MRNRDIIAASVVLGFSFISIMVVVARFLWVYHRPGKDHKHGENEYSVERQSPFFFKGGALGKFFTQKQERRGWVPTLSGIIKAGDEGIYSSTLFDSLQGHPGGIPLETLHDAFANNLRARPTSERSNYPSEITKFLLTTKKGLRRSQSVGTNRDDGHGRGRPELPPRPQRNSIDLAEMGLTRARSRKVAPILVPAFTGSVVGDGQGPAHGLWAQDLQHALYSEGRTGVKITARELAALSVILGSPVEPSRVQDGEKTERRTAVGKGAYGLSISGAATDDGGYHISLTRHKRSISQLPARGSGYSTLFAKHLASGSLPFSSDAKTINSILVTAKTLDALKSGAQLQLQKATPHAPASTFLANLPHAKLPSFHNLVPATSSTPTSTPTLLHAIANLPFTGGFTPLASAPLIATVQFVASGGLVPGRLLQRLEALVEKVHRHSPGLHLFGLLHEDKSAGLLFREREKLGKLAIGSLKSADEPLADKVARMHRYITLLERLMCLVPDMEPHNVLSAVREELKKQMERSYEDAVAAYLKDNESATTTMNHKRHSGFSRHSAQHSRHSKDFSISSGAPTPIPASPGSRMSVTSPRDSSTFPLNNLGRHIEGVLKTSLPLDIPTIALVARMVIGAWTLSVGTVAWEEGEEGFRVPDVDAMPEKMFMW